MSEEDPATSVFDPNPRVPESSPRTQLLNSISVCHKAQFGTSLVPVCSITGDGVIVIRELGLVLGCIYLCLFDFIVFIKAALVIFSTHQSLSFLPSLCPFGKGEAFIESVCHTAA